MKTQIKEKSIYINGFSRESVMRIIREESGGKKSRKDLNGNGQYRGLEDTKCLVGCFIPDNSYKDSYDENYDLIRNIFGEVEIFMPMRVEVLTELQGLHDGSLLNGLEGENYLNAIEEQLIALENTYYQGVGRKKCY